MALTLDEMRAYVAAGEDDLSEEDEQVLELCLNAAIAWFEGAGMPKGTEGSLYELGVKMLAASWFATRGNDTGVNLSQVPIGVYSIKHMISST